MMATPAKTGRKAKAKSAAKKKVAPTRSKAKGKSKSATSNGGAAMRALRKRALSILTGLEKQHPDAHCELDFTSGLELLIETILAAQCTD